MLNKNNIDQKIFFLFLEAYENLYEKGEITVQQRDRILSLLDKYEKYTPTEFEEELNKIFD